MKKPTPKSLRAGFIPYKLIRSRSLHAKNLADAERIRKERAQQVLREYGKQEDPEGL